MTHKQWIDYVIGVFAFACVAAAIVAASTLFNSIWPRSTSTYPLAAVTVWSDGKPVKTYLTKTTGWRGHVGGHYQFTDRATSKPVIVSGTFTIEETSP